MKIINITEASRSLKYCGNNSGAPNENTVQNHLNIALLRGSLPKTGPLRFGSENQFPLNFAHEYILVQK